MPRPLRPIAPGLVYHVVNRGNNRQNVFFKTGDYEAFLTDGWHCWLVQQRPPLIVNMQKTATNADQMLPEFQSLKIEKY
jgi:hypothetical protein